MTVNTTPEGKRYRLGHHAQKRMGQRGIKKRELEHVLDNYDIGFNDVKGNPCFVGDVGNGRRLRVVVVKDSNPLRIKTAIVL